MFTQGCCWCSKQTTRYPRKPGPTPCPACAALLRHSLPPSFLPILALRLLFSVFTEACSRSTRLSGPKCPSNDRVRNAPSTQGPRHVPRAWHCFGKAYPLLFFLFWLCSCYSPCTEGCPWSGGGGGATCQSRRALLMHHGRPAFLPILPCYTTRPRVPFKEAFAGMPPLDGVLACSACC